MNKTPVIPQTDYPKSNIPYRVINHPFRFGFIVPGKGISIEKDSNGILYISSESGMDVADLVAGDNIELTRTEDGKIVVSAVSTITNVAAGDNVTINIDPDTGTAVINSVTGGEVNEHYQGVFDTADDLIEHDSDPEEGDYGLIKSVTYSDGGSDSWNGQFKYCFYINGAWTVVDQMLTFTTDTDLIQQFYSVGGSSPVIYLHKIAMTGDFNDLKNPPIVATPEVTVEGSTVSATCATEGADIFYTTDGTMPHVTATKYTGPVTVAQPTTFRFVGVKNGMINSLEAVATSDYELDAPTISLDSDTGTVTMENPNLDGNNDPIGNIYYTTDGSTPDENSQLYESPFVITNATNFKLIVINTDDSHESPVASQSYQKCATPRSYSTSTNWITGNSNVEFKCATTGAIMHYTVDGSTPDYQSAVCSGRVYGRIYEQQLVKIMAVAENYVPSSVFQYNFGYAKPSAPEITFDSETNLVTLSKTGNALSVSSPKIFYTTDGSTPTINSALYSEPFPVTNGMTVKAVLLAFNQYLSDVASKSITILKMPSSIYDSNTGTLTLTDLNPGGVIHYTTDGSTPTAQSATYVAPIVLTGETEIQFISVVQNVGQSRVSYMYFDQAVKPIIKEINLNISTGDYQIVIENPNGKGKIHYTTDGSTPTYQSPVYSTPVSRNIFDGELTVKAIVVMTSDTVPSQVATLVSGNASVTAPEITVDDDTNEVTIGLAGNTAEIPLQTNNNVPSMGARIYYTTDGTTPTENSTLYTGSFAVGQGVSIVKAIAVCYGRYSSQYAPYPIRLSDPTIVLLNGQQQGISYEGKVIIINNNEDEIGTIFYTTDGSVPTIDNGIIFNTGTDLIEITGNTTIKARVIYVPSGLSSGVSIMDVLDATLYCYPNDSSYGTCYIDGTEATQSGKKYYFTEGGFPNVTLLATPQTGYAFQKWQSSSDGITWTDIGGAGATYQFSINNGQNYYYRAVFEANNIVLTLGVYSEFGNMEFIDTYNTGITVRVNNIHEDVGEGNGWVVSDDRQSFSKSFPIGSVLNANPSFPTFIGQYFYHDQESVETPYTMNEDLTIIATYFQGS